VNFLLENEERNFSTVFFYYFGKALPWSSRRVPGVSGGTIAFISGIYEELITPR